MERSNRNGKLSKKSVRKSLEIFLDKENDFSVIKIAEGINQSLTKKMGSFFQKMPKFAFGISEK